MKKLITIALLTFSTCSLMAEFPVREDNFNRFSETADWVQHQFIPRKYKSSPYLIGHRSKINGELIIVGYDKTSQSEICIFLNDEEELIACVKNLADGTQFFSVSTFEQELAGGNILNNFMFDESRVVLVTCTSTKGDVIFVWKLWQKNQ